MKKTLFISILGLLMMFSSCTKEDQKIPADGLLIATSVVDAICGDMILAIQDEKFYDLGEKGYEHGGIKYGSAFLTRAPCSFPSSNLPNGSTDERKRFMVRISDQPFPGNDNCATCMATFGKAPNKFYYIKVE